MEYVRAVSVKEVPPGTMKPVRLSGIDILIINTGKNFYAIEDRCPHMHAMLSYGTLRGNAIQCMNHGAVFNLPTGMPDSITDRQLVKFEVKVEEENLYVLL